MKKLLTILLISTFLMGCDARNMTPESYKEMSSWCEHFGGVKSIHYGWQEVYVICKSGNKVKMTNERK